MKSGNLNFLEPSGPLQACNGTALRFMYIIVSNSSAVVGLCVVKGKGKTLRYRPGVAQRVPGS
jgi:NADH:ubiquinone oxidoreductase subunit K